MFALCIIALLFINGSLGDKMPINAYNAVTSPCATSTQTLSVTNTWGNIEYSTITSTTLGHDHTVYPVYNTIVIPSTTVSTLTVTWLMPGTTETSVLTVQQTKYIPVTETATHTVVLTKTTKAKATEVDVLVMTLTQTLIHPYTSTFTTPRIVETIVHTYTTTTKTVTDWNTVTTKKPIIVTWTNFKTYEVHVTKTITKNHSKPKHVSTTITTSTVITKCY